MSKCHLWSSIFAYFSSCRMKYTPSLLPDQMDTFRPWYFWEFKSASISNSLFVQHFKDIKYSQQCRNFLQVSKHIVSCFGCSDGGNFWTSLLSCRLDLETEFTLTSSILGCFEFSSYSLKIGNIDRSNSFFILIIICECSDAYFILRQSKTG